MQTHYEQLEPKARGRIILSKPAASICGALSPLDIRVFAQLLTAESTGRMRVQKLSPTAETSQTSWGEKERKAKCNRHGGEIDVALGRLRCGDPKL
eukprot:1211817-Rhodomonas_salina.1